MLQKSISTKGFTLVELLIVIVVIAILAAISIVAYNGIQDRAKTSSGQTAASQVLKKAEIYRTIRSTGSGYPSYAELSTAASTTAEASLDDPSILVDGSTLSANAVFHSNAVYNDGNSVVYLSGIAGACIYYWDYTQSSPGIVSGGTGACLPY